MKICYLAPKNIHTERWVKYFLDKGHDVHLISYEVSNIDGLKVYKLPKLKNDYMSFIIRCFKVRKLIKDIKPDIIHAHYIGGYGWLGALTGFHPFVASVWGSDILIEPKISRIKNVLTKYTLKKADLITCDGENTNKTIADIVDSEKINLIYHGVDTKLFSRDEKEESIGGAKWEDNSNIVISIRNLYQIYDIVTLIKSIPFVIEQVPNAKFIIAGSGIEENNLKALAEKLMVSDCILFIGKIQHKNLHTYFSSASVYVSTSLSDGGIAVSTVEAMSCGLAPIVTDVGDNKIWIHNDENGYVIPIKSPKSLAEKIVYLLRNKNIRLKFGEFNRNLVKNKADYYKEMEKMQCLYDSLIE